MPSGYPSFPMQDNASTVAAFNAINNGIAARTHQIVIPVTLSATITYQILLPSQITQITSIYLLTSTALAVDGTNYWSFQILNVTDSASLQSGTGPTTPTGARLTASTYTGGTATVANTPYSMALDQNAGDLVTTIASGKVIQFIATKTGTAANLTNCSLFVYYRLIY